MTRTEILENMKAQFKKLMLSDSPSINVTTSDGKSIIVMSEDVAVGVEAFLLNADNTQTPLDNGDYILSDGRTITIASGVISDIKSPEPEQSVNEPDAAVMTDEAPTDTPTEPEDKAVDNDIAERLTALEEAVKSMLEMLQGMMSKTEQTMSEVKRISEQPSADKVKVTKKLSTSDKSISMEEIRQLREKK